MDEHGYLHIMTRTDDVLNTAGHRLSTGRIEEVVNSHHQVVESAVIGLSDAVKGELPFAIIVPADGEEFDPANLIKEAN